MKFGDRISFNDGNDNISKGVFLKDLNPVEALVQLDDNKDKTVQNKKSLTFLSSVDNMNAIQALVIADYISKEKYDGHYTLLCFTTGCKFCFGTLDKINYNTTSLMASGRTIEEAIKTAIDKNIDADKISSVEDKMFK